MKKIRSTIVKSHDPEYDFKMAIDRLNRQSPIHPELIELKRKGELKINLTSVSKEAGRSRTLISGSDCRYPDIALLISNCKFSSANFPAPKSKSDAQKMISALRKENSILRTERDILATRLQDALNVVHRNLKRAAETSRRADRVERRRTSKTTPNGTANIIRLAGD